ncbi:hypothetical protein [Emcibacter sp. SYSU 3D8]|uniref:hypothetical protein n=1 Tax=Emcibacter sp. SYSU 3D8 TaxID=3133969 RepID=UPI0031FECF17
MNIAKCGGCGVQLNTPAEMTGASRPPCPECGSSSRVFDDTVVETIEMLDSWSMKHRRPGERQGKKKSAIAESFDGWEYNRDENDWVRVSRSVDRLNDWYRETITTRDGRILRDVSEPLSQHRGRGAARRNE